MVRTYATVAISARESTAGRLQVAMLDLLAEVGLLDGALRDHYDDWLRDGKAATDRVANRALCIVLLAAAWVEAVVNETYISCTDGGFSAEHPLRERPQACEALAKVWKEWHPPSDRGRDPSPLKKSTQAMKALGAQHPKNVLPSYGQVDLLFEMRNALTHGKPQPLTHGALSRADLATRLGELQRRLEGRFATAKGVPASVIFMWARVMGHGCATWAASSAQSFVDEWRRELAKAGAVYHPETKA